MTPSDLTTTELTAVAGHLLATGVQITGEMRSSRISGGRSNLTFLLRDDVSRWVLRMPPRVGRTPSAHDVAREHRVTVGLQQTAVPVARPVALCEDEGVAGFPFSVASFVEGRSIQSREDLDRLDDGALDRVADRLVEVLVALHRVDHVAVGLGRFGRPDEYAARQLRRWTGQWGIVAPEDPRTRRAADELVAGLTRMLPGQPSTGIVHGDFRIDNTLLRLDDDAVEVAAVVDWELSTIGDPVADVATMCAYRHPAFDLVLGSRTAWTSDRLPDADGLAARYESAGGVPLDGWAFHLALADLKIAVIAAGIDYRHRAGATSGAGFGSAGEAVVPFLEAGLEALGVDASRH